jgi:long-chain acyl-CoA synthetase
MLQLIERWRATHAYFAPILFKRLLQLPEAARRRYDLSSLEFVVHAAAPCPPDVKRAMIEWWGPVIHEFYGATETRALTTCTAQEWLDRPGTVGRALPSAVVRIVDAEGCDRPPGETGEIIGAHQGVADFTYHGDEAKRRAAERDGLIVTGDVGYLDEAGYLFICDRSNDMIISGGVNIYPAEIEAELCRAPGVLDCAVFGVPDEEYGEAVMAVVQSADGRRLDPDALRGFLAERLSGFKVPRTVEQVDELPREESGKIFKRRLREPYWRDLNRRI